MTILGRENAFERARTIAIQINQRLAEWKAPPRLSTCLRIRPPSLDYIRPVLLLDVSKEDLTSDRARKIEDFLRRAHMELDELFPRMVKP